MRRCWPLPSVGAVLAVAALALFLEPLPAGAQMRSIQGRVVDLETGEAVADATITIRRPGRTEPVSSALTGPGGRFQVEIPIGEAGLRIQVEHLAYGRFNQPMRPLGAGRLLHIEISRTAIQLEPIDVRVDTPDARADRVRGTQRNVVSREQIEQTLGTAGNLGTVLERFVTGVRVRTPQATPGAPMCVEFRSSRTLDNPNECHPPVIVMDGVRVSSPLTFFSWLPLEDVERLEVIPPGEAGVQYGTDSNFGVLLVETRSGGFTREEAPPAVVEPRYDFAVEGVPYAWKRTFLGAFVGNAIGVGIGIAAANSCLDFNGLSDHFLDSACGSARTAAVRIGLVSLPLLGAGWGAGRAGKTDRSHGRFWHTVLGSALVGIPGYLIATAGPDEAWPGADWTGGVFVLIGVPAVATLTDRLFRIEREPPSR